MTVYCFACGETIDVLNEKFNEKFYMEKLHGTITGYALHDTCYLPDNPFDDYIPWPKRDIGVILRLPNPAIIMTKIK